MPITVTNLHQTPNMAIAVSRRFADQNPPESRVNRDRWSPVTPGHSKAVPMQDVAKLHKWSRNCHIVFPMGWMEPGRCNVWVDAKGNIGFEQNAGGRYNVTAMNKRLMGLKVTVPSSIAKSIEDGQHIVELTFEDGMTVANVKNVLK